MVAVAILGLSLTVILSAQAGLYSGGAYAQHTSVAIGLARCRMTELEEELLKLGYPQTDQKDEGACCQDDSRQDMRCSWKVEKIELPQAKPPELASSAGGLALGTPPAGSAASPLGMVTQLASNPQALSGDGGIAAITSALKDQGGTAGIEAMAMSFVYPTLKLMLEASIRKVTVTVNWKEGLRERDITVVQYVTRPVSGPATGGIGADGGVLPLSLDGGR